MNDLTITEPANVDAIRSRILTIRGVQVMLDRDLAELYGVPTKRLNEQVKRNSERFPSTFMFHLANDEMRELVANCDRQEVLCLLIPRQIQHPRHPGKDVNTIGKTAKPRNFGKRISPLVSENAI